MGSRRDLDDASSLVSVFFVIYCLVVWGCFWSGGYCMCLAGTFGSASRMAGLCAEEELTQLQDFRGIASFANVESFKERNFWISPYCLLPRRTLRRIRRRRS